MRRFYLLLIHLEYIHNVLPMFCVPFGIAYYSEGIWNYGTEKLLNIVRRTFCIVSNENGIAYYLLLLGPFLTLIEIFRSYFFRCKLCTERNFSVWMGAFCLTFLIDFLMYDFLL